MGKHQHSINVDWERAVASAVCLQATTDYITTPDQRDEIIKFFESDWGQALCKRADMDANKMLKQLKDGSIIKKWYMARNGKLTIRDEYAESQDALFADLLLEQQDRT